MPIMFMLISLLFLERESAKINFLNNSKIRSYFERETQNYRNVETSPKYSVPMQISINFV